ncbi:MAG: MFS transporter [Pirellulales bacterium]|nr:MFS transporter [Pirellulales bacterium]
MNPRYERWRWLTFAITWLIYASFYLTRQSFSAAKLTLPYQPGISLVRKSLGNIDSVYLTFYMLGQFIFGPLGDRFGPRRVLFFGLILSVAAAVAFGFSSSLWAFLVCSALQGLAQSSGWSNTNKAMSSWFSVGERGRVLGWWCTHYTFGPAVGVLFAGWAMEHFSRSQFALFPIPASAMYQPLLPCQTAANWAANLFFGTQAPFWPAAFWVPASVVAVVAVLTWLFLRDCPEDVGLPPIDDYHGNGLPNNQPVALPSPLHSTNARSNKPWRHIQEVLSESRIWMLAIAYFSVKLVRYSFIFWGPLFVAENTHSGTLGSTMIAAVMPFGGLVGVVAAGYLSDRVFGARRAPVAILSLLGVAAVISAGMAGIHNIWVMAIFFFLVGMFLFGPDSMISATASVDFGTKHGAATAVGVVNGVGSIGGILGGYLPGAITQGSNWTPLFIVMFIGLIVSAAVLTPLWNVRQSSD